MLLLLFKICVQCIQTVWNQHTCTFKERQMIDRRVTDERQMIDSYVSTSSMWSTIPAIYCTCKENQPPRRQQIIVSWLNGMVVLRHLGLHEHVPCMAFLYANYRPLSKGVNFTITTLMVVIRRTMWRCVGTYCFTGAYVWCLWLGVRCDRSKKVYII
jgi:hypothetical protein